MKLVAGWQELSTNSVSCEGHGVKKSGDVFVVLQWGKIHETHFATTEPVRLCLDRLSVSQLICFFPFALFLYERTVRARGIDDQVCR